MRKSNMTHEELRQIVEAYPQDSYPARAARDALLLALSRHVEPVHVFHAATMALITKGKACLEHVKRIEMLCRP